jgi:hypothetical protein
MNEVESAYLDTGVGGADVASVWTTSGVAPLLCPSDVLSQSFDT